MDFTWLSGRFRLRHAVRHFAGNPKAAHRCFIHSSVLGGTVATATLVYLTIGASLILS